MRHDIDQAGDGTKALRELDLPIDHLLLMPVGVAPLLFWLGFLVPIAAVPAVNRSLNFDASMEKLDMPLVGIGPLAATCGAAAFFEREGGFPMAVQPKDWASANFSAGERLPWICKASENAGRFAPTLRKVVKTREFLMLAIHGEIA